MLRLNNLKARTAMNATVSLLVICVKAIICLLLYNFHDPNFSVLYKDRGSHNSRSFISSYMTFI